MDSAKHSSGYLTSAVPAGTEWVCDPDPGLSAWATFNQTSPKYGFRRLAFVRRARLQPCRKSLAHEAALQAAEKLTFCIRARKGRLRTVALLILLCLPGTIMPASTWGQENGSAPSAPNEIAPPIPPTAAPPIPSGAVVLDHVVAVINGSVILQSDVMEEMGYAFLQPFTAGAARNTPQRALQRLIDRDLILQQMETAQTVTPPTPEEVKQRIAELRSVIPECVPYHCQTDTGWQAFLRNKGLTEKEVEAHWAQRMLILSFIQSRFGAGVHITRAEIADYYNKTLAPQLRARAVKPPALEAVSSRIEEILLQQRVSSLLLEWLQSLKSEGSVSILDPAYGKVGTTGSGDDSESGGQS